MRNRREASIPDISNTLPSALGKLGASDTQHKGLEEAKDFLRQHRSNEDKLTYFLSSLTPSNEHMLAISHKREYIKLYGTFAEVLEHEALPYLPRIFAALTKKLKECNSNLNESISFAYGSVIHNTLHTLPDLPSSCSQLLGILKPLFENLSSTNKILQVGSGLCITKIIQHSPLECLRFLLDRLTMKLLQALSGGKAQCQVVESIISLILSVEHEFAQYSARVVPELMSCAFNEDFLCRKQVVETFYTLAAVVPASVAPFASEIMAILNKVRTDKAKPVRESAVEAMNLYKKMVPDTPAAGRISQKSPKEEVKPKSIFRGPVNANFFKAANNDSVVEAPEKPFFGSREEGFVEEMIEDSPRSDSPSFREETGIEKFEFEQEVDSRFGRGQEFGVVPDRDFGNNNKEKKQKQRGYEMEDEDLVVGRERGVGRDSELLAEKKNVRANEFQSNRTSTFGFGGPVHEKKKEPDRSLDRTKGNQNRVEELKECCKEIKYEFDVFREQVRVEVTQINQRLGALEEMISTVSQLFDAKLKQLTCNPNIASLLRN